MMTLTTAYTLGLEAALAAYGIKEAGWLGNVARDIGQGLVGSSAVRKELVRGTAFRPGGTMTMKNLLWPGYSSTAGKAMGALGIGLPLYGAYTAYKGETGDPREGKLTNALSMLGQSAGATLGSPAGGVIGGGLLGAVGSRMGRGLGRVLGSKAEPQPQPHHDPNYYQGPYYQ